VKDKQRLKGKSSRESISGRNMKTGKFRLSRIEQSLTHPLFITKTEQERHELCKGFPFLEFIEQCQTALTMLGKNESRSTRKREEDFIVLFTMSRSSRQNIAREHQVLSVKKARDTIEGSQTL
jgi:hypothetical protein